MQCANIVMGKRRKSIRANRLKAGSIIHVIYNTYGHVDVFDASWGAVGLPGIKTLKPKEIILVVCYVRDCSKKTFLLHLIHEDGMQLFMQEDRVNELITNGILRLALHNE